MDTRWSRRDVLRGTAASAGLLILAGCSTDGGPVDSTTGPTAVQSPTATPTSPGFGPAPRTIGGLTALATVEQTTLRLHTRGGDLRFWPGVRLSGALPGADPGTIAGTAAHYRRWFAQMAGFGVRFVRLDRLHPPACYAELARYNSDHPAAPLYLVQGVRLPEVRSAASDLFTASVTRRMRDAVAEASRALHGDLAAGGHGTGAYSTDVSPWVAAWTLDIGWSAERLAANDSANERAGRHEGRFFGSTRAATPTEHWLAARLDELAALEAERGITVPLAIVNRPETDPIDHPRPASPPQNVATIDPRHLVVSDTWPAGMFVVYEAPPFSPAFISADEAYGADADPYLAYLIALRTETTIPLMVGSFGVTSALGSGYPGIAGRSHGDHNEPEKFEIEARLLRLFAEHGFAGGLLGHWHDDWSARTWNTTARRALIDPSHRTLIHDPLTAEQWGGIVAVEPRRRGEVVAHEAPQNGLQRVLTDFDASWLYLTLEFSGRVTSPLEIGFNMIEAGGIRLPGGSGDPTHDIAIRTVPTMSTTYLFVRAALDPLQVDGVPLVAIPRDFNRGWHLQRLLQQEPAANNSAPGMSRLAYQDVGNLKLGSWEPGDADFDSRATWHLSRESGSAPARLRYRLPWGLVNMLDPSARGALRFAGNEPAIVTARAMTITVESSTPGSPVDFQVSLPTWSAVRYSERVKQGAGTLSEAFASTGRLPANAA